MRFAQLALIALVGMEGVYAGHPGNQKGHLDKGLVEHLVKPSYPKKTDTYANRARPLLPPSNKKGNTRRDLAPSLDGTCGGSKTCEGSSFGPCCSRDGWCGSSVASCGTGCREGYGICSSARLAERQATDSSACDAPSSTAGGTPNVVVASPTSTSTSAALAVSTNGKCGATAKMTCTGSRFGTCCNSAGSCGSTTAFCAKTRGCQPLYGKCT